VRRALLLLVVSCSACLEAPPANLDGGSLADAFECTGDCCGNPASSLVDDFEDGVASPWTMVSTDPGCLVDERDGTLHVSNTAFDKGCYYQIDGILLAGGQTASIELVDAGDGEPQAEFRLEFRTGEKVSFERTLAGLRVTNRPIGEGARAVKLPVPYGPEHRFLRFRGGTVGESVFLETSSDGVEWPNFYTHEFEQPGTDDCVELEIGTFGPVGASAEEEVVFDNFNRFP
jgi:hypothetical protein